MLGLIRLAATQATVADDVPAASGAETAGGKETVSLSAGSVAGAGGGLRDGISWAPVPTASEIPALVGHARAAGLAVELRTRGDLSQIPPGVGLAVYRIAQEALANAARHGPHAHTMLELELANGRIALVAETSGPLLTSSSSERERPRYGLVGMRERATALGGDFAAGPTLDGW